MAVVFAVLAIICYSNSIVSAGYGAYKTEVANVQMTVFAAACAVLCGVNVVGALLITAINSITIPSPSSNESIASTVVNALNKSTEERLRQEKEKLKASQYPNSPSESGTTIDDSLGSVHVSRKTDEKEALPDMESDAGHSGRISLASLLSDIEKCSRSKEIIDLIENTQDIALSDGTKKQLIEDLSRLDQLERIYGPMKNDRLKILEKYLS